MRPLVAVQEKSKLERLGKKVEQYLPFMKADKTKLATLSGWVEMNEWGIYNAAHKMMETQHWGLRTGLELE